MRSRYVAVQFVAAGLAMPPACLAVIAISLGFGHPFFSRHRLPLGDVAAVVTSDDAVFIAENATRRVYKFDLNGNPLRWIDIHGGPISITRRGPSVMVHYSAREWALEDPAFRVHDPHGIVASVERTWWGHPVLVVRRPEGTTRASMQPWYLTVLQSPYPGLLWSPWAIGLVMIALWARDRGRRLEAPSLGRKFPSDPASLTSAS